MLDLLLHRMNNQPKNKISERTHFKIITFSDRELTYENNLLKKSCDDHSIELDVVIYSPWPANSIKLMLLQKAMASYDDELILLFADASDVNIYDGQEEILKRYEALSADIIFNGEANFYFRNSQLQYFFWKFYPRDESLFCYLNSGLFIGKVRAVRQMLDEIIHSYKLDLSNINELIRTKSDQYFFHRYFLDNHYRPNSNLTIRIDTDCQLFGCLSGRMSSIQSPERSWIFSFMHFRIERIFLKRFSIQHHLSQSKDYEIDRGRLINTTTGTRPSIIHIPGTGQNFQKLFCYLSGHEKSTVSIKRAFAKILSYTAYVGAFFIEKIIFWINKGNFSQKEIFRYAGNQTIGFTTFKKQILHRLQEGTPFAYISFSKDELQSLFDASPKNVNLSNTNSAIKDVLQGSFQCMNENLFIGGMPCSLEHSSLRRFAEQISVPSLAYVSNRSIHHNLSIIPSLFVLLRNRHCYFVKTEDQNLDIFKNYFIDIDPEKIIDIDPNHQMDEYNRLKNYALDPESVIIFTCGTLARLIIPSWQLNNASCTFIDLDDSIQDLIEKRSDFKLFLKSDPFTRNYKGNRHFLFGKKSHCPECYNLSDC